MFHSVALFPGPSDEAPPIRPANPNGTVQSHSSSHSLLSEQVITPIKVIIMSRDEAKLAEYLSGEGAQTLIDAVHEVCLRASWLPGPRLTTLTSFSTALISTHHSQTKKSVDLSELPPRLRRKCLSALCQICSRRALLPRSLKIPPCYDRSGFPQYRGGFADVWKGEYQGRSVAAKVVRVYSTSDLHKITKVLFADRPVPQLTCRSQSM